MLQLIPRPLHAVADYLWSAAFYFAPELFGFADDKAATNYARLRGGSATVYSILTRYELGLIKLIPFNLHLLIDLLGALVGFAAPKLFGFDKNKKAVQTNLAFSLIELSAVLLSKRDK